MTFIAPGAFDTADNFYNITRNFAFIGMMAMGMTAVIITGGIDLSVGSVMGLVGIVAGLCLQAGCPAYTAIAAGLLTGLAAGAVNGVLIAYVKLSAFVVTLGMLSIARSLAIVLSQNKMIYDFGPGSDTIFALGGGEVLGIANPVWMLILLVLLFGFVFRIHRLGPPSLRDRRQRAGGPADRRAGGPGQAAGLHGVRPDRGDLVGADHRLAGVGDQRARHRATSCGSSPLR